MEMLLFYIDRESFFSFCDVSVATDEEKETRDGIRLSALICITQLLLGGSAIGRVQVGKKKSQSQAIRGKLRLISLLCYRAAVRGEPEGLL